MIGAILLAPALCVPGTAAHRAGVFWRCLIAAPGLKVRARAASSLQALLAAAGMAPGRFQVTPPRVHAGAGLPSHQRKHLWSFNEARRESPGSRERRGFSVRGSVDASMRPGANRRDQPFGQQYLAPDCGLASMRPGANRRDHDGATSVVVQMPGLLQLPHHKQLRSTLRALAERPRCNT